MDEKGAEGKERLQGGRKGLHDQERQEDLCQDRPDGACLHIRRDKQIHERKERDRDIELKRLETERKHAEGTSEKNANTSKKKIQASEKQKSNERKAALDREDRAARREMLGIEEAEVPASQVGNRRYARGRAYDPDRFKNPEDKSAAAEKASEGADKTPADGSAAPETVEAAAEAVKAPENTAANNTPEQNETTNESKDET